MNTIEFSGHADFEWAVQINRFSLKLLGLWPLDVISSQGKLYSDLRLFSVIIAITFVCTIPSLHSLVRVWGDMTAMIDNMLFSLPLLTVSMKLLVMWWKRETLLPLMTMIVYDWIKSKSSDEKNIMIRRARHARLITACSYIIMISTLMVLVVVSGLGYTLRHVTNFTDAVRPLPVQVYYIFETSVSPQFEVIFIVQCVTLLMIAFSYTGIDNFLGLLIFHICGQLENLTNRLCRMRDSKDFTAALKINVIDHIRLIRSVAIIENTFTLLLFILFLYFGTVFCVYGFLFVMVIFEENDVSIKRGIFLIMVICTGLIHMCIYCAVGELLVIKKDEKNALCFQIKEATRVFHIAANTIDSYEEVYNAVYECKWHMLKTNEARNLILLMIRTNKPLYITAGKILPMTMSTFCSILRTSGGYISVLLANRN